MSTFRNLLMARSRRRNAPAVKGLVGAWKGYGRSNDEDASTRDILYDYSGNGHDIELSNFAFSGMSGWGGYKTDFSNDVTIHLGGRILGSKTYKTITIDRVPINEGTVFLETTTEDANITSFTVKVTGLEANGARIYGDYVSGIDWQTDGIYEFPSLTGINKGLSISAPTSETLQVPIVIEQLPLYPGALVSDGVDDRGWCGGLPLKDDFTVVAIRKIIPSSRQGYLLTAFGPDSVSGIDITVIGFEGQFNSSFGAHNNYKSTDCPPLFTWMSRYSYNGISINTDAYKSVNKVTRFYLFTDTRAYNGTYALYDLRIYDHSLTEDELRIVRDEMMAEYEANVNPLGSVHYIADWDAKGRSNDEDADARDEWADKVGGSIIKLSNYDFGGKSGWGEYPYNFLNILEANRKTDITSHRLSIHSANEAITSRIYQNVLGRERFTCRIKISGLSKGVSAGQVDSFAIYSVNTWPVDFITSADGIYDVDVPFAENDDNILLYLKPTVPSVDTTLDEPVVVEMLPTIAGVLASDGVDDYGEIPSSKDYLNLSEVNTMLCFARIQRNGARYAYAVCTPLNYPSLIRLWASVDVDGLPNVGSPTKSGSVMTNMYALTRDVEYDDNKTSLNLASYIIGTTRLYSVCTIQRIVLIRENIKEDIDFLKWKVEKEYRDWCKENGYDPTPMLTIPEAI